MLSKNFARQFKNNKVNIEYNVELLDREINLINAGHLYKGIHPVMKAN